MGSQDCAPDTKKKFTGLYHKTDSSHEDDFSFSDMNATMHPFFHPGCWHVYDNLPLCVSEPGRGEDT